VTTYPIEKTFTNSEAYQSLQGQGSAPLLIPSPAATAEGDVLVPADYPAHRIALRRGFSQSRWKSLACPRKARFTYVERLETKTKALPLEVGKLTHSVVSELLTNGSLSDTDKAVECWVQWHARERDKLDRAGQTPYWTEDTLAESAALVRALSRRWLRTRDQLTGIVTGINFRVPILHPRTKRRDPLWDYAGEFDGLVSLSSDAETLWVWELKTTATSNRSDYESSLQFDPQRWGYAWAAAKLFGYKRVGVVYDVLRKRTTAPLALSCCTRAACKRRRLAYEEKTLSTPVREVSTTSGDTVPLHGAAECVSCGGTGYVGVSMSSPDVWPASRVREAMSLLCAAGSFKAVEQRDADKWNTFLQRCDNSEDSSHFRIWRLPDDEHVAAFEREIYDAAHEFKWRETNDRWPTQRGQCHQWGRDCQFAPLCPTLPGGLPLDLFDKLGEKRRASSWEDTLPF